MVAPFTGLKSSAAFPVTRKTNKDITSIASNGLDVLADILQNSKFEEQRINRERDVILREMQEVCICYLCT
jgi:hypothetical protein